MDYRVKRVQYHFLATESLRQIGSCTLPEIAAQVHLWQNLGNVEEGTVERLQLSHRVWLIVGAKESGGAGARWF